MDVAIHATLRWDSDNAWAASDPIFREALTRCGFQSGQAGRHHGAMLDPNLKPLPFGKIIGVATIADVRLTHHFGEAPISAYDRHFGDWSLNRYAWRFENTRLLPEPIPFKGRQDVLYLLDPAVEAQIDEQLGIPIPAEGFA